MADPATLDLAIAVLVCIGFGLIAYAARVLDVAGSSLASVLAFLIIRTTGYVWLFLLVLFVAIGVAATKMFWAYKTNLGVAEAKKGVRGWRNVLANGGVPAIIAAMTLVPGASKEDVALGFAAAIATASADTFASELGVLSKRTYLLTMPWKKVPPGTNGGVSNWGQLMALAGAIIAGVGGVVLLGISWTVAWIPVVAGWLGCQVDSVLGALFEEERGRAYGFLSKSDVNFLSIAIAAFGVLILLQV